MHDKQRKKLFFLSFICLVLAGLTFTGCPPTVSFCPDCDPAVAQSGCPGALDNVIPGQWIVRYSDATTSLDSLLPEFTVVLHTDGGDTISLDSFLTVFDTTLLTNPKYELLGSTPELLDALNDHFIKLKTPSDTLTQNDVLLLKTCGCRMALFWINPIKIDLNTSVEQATNKTRTQDNGIPGKVTSVDVNRWVSFGPDEDKVLPQPTGRSCYEKAGHPENGELRPCNQDSLNTPFTPASLAEDTLTVAVIDSGLDYLHDNLDKRPYQSELRSAVWVNKDEMDNAQYGSPIHLDDWDNLMRTQPQTNCYYGDLVGYNFLHDTHMVDDRQGHGTHVGGVIATAMDMDPAVRVMPLKIAGYVEENGQEEFTADLFSVLCGMEYAIDKDVTVINMSLGYYAPTPNVQLRQLVTKADIADILIVASVGNDGLDIDCCQHWPSNLSDTCTNVISVGALDSIKLATPYRLASYSNRGSKVNIAAPGTNVLGPATGTGFQQINKSGTSMAAALISRQAVLIRNSAGQPSAAATKNALMTMNTGSANTICVGGGVYYDYTQYPEIWSMIGYVP